MTDTTLVDAGPASNAGLHPLEPLTADEITRAVAILRGQRSLPDTVRFSTVQLREPDKRAVLARDCDPTGGGGSIPREAFVILMDRADGAVVEAIVSLTEGAVTAWTPVPGVQPRLMAEEFAECEEMLRGHPEFLAALARRGITDPSLLMIDPWSAGGALGNERRLCRALTWVRSEPGDNGYARPVEGLIAIVDLNAMELVELQETDPDARHRAVLR